MRRAEERVALAWRRASLADRGVEAGQGVRSLGGLPCVYKYPCTGVFWFEPSGIRFGGRGVRRHVSCVPVIIRRSSIPTISAFWIQFYMCGAAIFLFSVSTVCM